MKQKILNKQARKQQQKQKKTAPALFTDKRLIIAVIVLITATFLAFSPALRNQLVNWDDYNYIRDNPVVRSLSADNLAHIFDFRTFIMGNYHPLTILSYAIEYKIVGDQPFLYHFSNILLHLTNVLLLLFIVWKMTGKPWVALVAAALFALHPMRVESVAWAAERKDVLYTLFYFLSLIWYIRFLHDPGKKSRNYIVTLVFFLLSILSKGQAVVLPLTLLLVDYWYDRKLTRQNLVNKIPFFALSLLFGLLAVNAQASSLTVERMVSHPLPERLIIAAYNIAAYLVKFVYPYDLACFYGYPPKSEMMPVYLGAVLAVALLAVVFTVFRKNKPVVFGTLFFLATISIVIQLMPVGNAIIADRYTYIPYTGLFILAAVLIDRLIVTKPSLSGIVRVLVAVQLLVFGVASFLQSRTWENNITLWNRVIQHNPEEGMAYNNLAIDYLDRKEYAEAIRQLKLSTRYSETYPEVYRAYHNLGKAYSESGQPATGLLYYDSSLLIEPRYPDAWFGRGLTYTETGQYDKAIADFTTILSRLRPNDVKSLYSRGIAYNKKGQPDSAIADYTRAVQIRPDYAEPYTNRGNIYFNQGKYDAAISDYDQAIRFDPENAMNYLNRSYAHFRISQFDAALSDALKAAEMKAPVAPQYLEDLRKFSGKN